MKRTLKWGIPGVVLTFATIALARLPARSPGDDGEPVTVRVVRRDFSATVLATGAVRPQIGAEVKVGGSLFSDAMGASGTYEGTYIGMIDHNATTIARALGGNAPEKGMQGKLRGVSK